MRAFIAIEIDAAAREACAELINRMKDISARVAWVRPENLHLTLRFLGEVSEQQIDQLAAQLGSRVSHFSSFKASLRGVGVFPNARRPTVIWTGFECASGDLAGIQSESERAAVAIGLPPENRPFVAHVTLGRVRLEHQRGGVSDYLKDLSSFFTGVFTVDAVSLFSSELTPQGARYSRLHRLTLDGLPRARDL